jgi:hypothetical protein
MRIIKILILVFLSNILFGQNEPYGYLEKLDLGENILIKYDAQITTVII